jgi:hypothetical protein
VIFLHSSFRTSSTWMWSRFRKLDKVTAYCEIFHEGLASITRSQINQHSHRAWYSKHPAGAAYFLEYMPLVSDGGGTAGYDKGMAFDSFIPEGGILGNIGEAERDYIASLISHAGTLGRVPLLSCTRSLGRLPAIKSAFPGFHILIYRNLFRHWCSYSEQYARGNPGFFDTIRATIDNSCHDRFCNYLKDACPLDERAIDSANYFCAFVLLHIYLYGHVSDSADMIFDVDRAASHEGYRRAAEYEIEQRTGLSPDFSDIKAGISFAFLDSSQNTETKERICPMLPFRWCLPTPGANSPRRRWPASWMNGRNTSFMRERYLFLLVHAVYLVSGILWQRSAVSCWSNATRC